MPCWHLRDAEAARHEEEQEAKDRVRQSWEERILELNNALVSARAATKNAKLAETMDHPWEGRIVTRQEAQYARFTRTVTRTVTIKGFVRTYRPGVELPQNRRNFVAIGDVLVFSLRKDGTPGKDYEFFKRNEADWELEVSPVDA